MQPLDEFPIDIVKAVLGNHGIIPFMEYPDGQIHWGTEADSGPNPYLGNFAPGDFSSPGHYNLATIRVIAALCNKSGDVPEIEDELEKAIEAQG